MYEAYLDITKYNEQMRVSPFDTDRALRAKCRAKCIRLLH